MLAPAAIPITFLGIGVAVFVGERYDRW